MTGVPSQTNKKPEFRVQKFAKKVTQGFVGKLLSLGRGERAPSPQVMFGLNLSVPTPTEESPRPGAGPELARLRGRKGRCAAGRGDGARTWCTKGKGLGPECGLAVGGEGGCEVGVGLPKTRTSLASASASAWRTDRGVKDRGGDLGRDE